MKDLDPWFTDNLVCPLDKLPLRANSEELICQNGHAYPVVHQIPIMLPREIEHTNTGAAAKTFDIIDNLECNRSEAFLADKCYGNADRVDEFVQRAIAATNSNLYKPLIGKLSEYPIPELNIPPGKGQSFLDIGCNWGRWCIAASKMGYKPIGIDPSLESIFAAYRVSMQLNRQIRYIVADSRYLPFPEKAFDFAYSYSVFQHFSKQDVKISIEEIRRVLKNEGKSMIQMLNTYGLRNLFVQLRRGFREPKGFQTRYWSYRELLSVFGSSIGPSKIIVASFFTQGQTTDKHLFFRRHQIIVNLSEFLQSISEKVKFLILVADNLFIISWKNI